MRKRKLYLSELLERNKNEHLWIRIESKDESFNCYKGNTYLIAKYYNKEVEKWHYGIDHNQYGIIIYVK